MQIDKLTLAPLLLGLTLLPAGGCTKDDSSDETTGASSESDTSGATTTATTSATATATESTGTSAGSDSASGGTGASTATATDSTSASGSGTSAGTGATGCQTNDDCAVFSDCCSCEAVDAESNPPMCEKACEEMTCESWGVRAATCRDGTCVLTPVNCDDSTVVCDGPVPMCPDGFSPNVTADGTCYTGKCTPNELCAQ